MKSMNALILHDIRSMENVGSLFRTADAAGIDRVYLSGITPSPIDRFGRPVGKIAKAALGAEKSISWKETKDIAGILNTLKTEGYQIVAIEQSDRSVDYKSVAIQEPVAFILGNEVDGLAKDILGAADIIAEIPMQGNKESLNVAVAGGIALFRMLDC
jgi:23S rRNA (guanosine2251-2'-O)-methyltransferase